MSRHGVKNQERQGEQWKNSIRDWKKISRSCNIMDLLHSWTLLFALQVSSPSTLTLTSLPWLTLCIYCSWTHSFTCIESLPPTENSSKHQPGVDSGVKGGPEIVPADTLLLQTNNSALTGAGTGVQVLWQFYETLAVPRRCFSKSTWNEMACSGANDTMVLNCMICLFVSSQEGRRREGMYIWSNPNQFFCSCYFC